MHTKQQLAIQLRLSGKSYNEISKKLTVPKSTLSLWLQKIPLSLSAQQRLQQRMYSKGATALIKRNKLQTVLAIQRANTIRQESSKTIGLLSRRELFLIGTALYWGEGYKRGVEPHTWKCVDFTNSDPVMINFMMNFFQDYCQVSLKKFRIHLMLHDKTHEEVAKQFWSNLTHIPLQQFVKTSFALSKSSKGKRPKYRLPYGTIHIRINDVTLFFQIIGWIDGLKMFTSSALK